jgi:hypothetical protein
LSEVATYVSALHVELGLPLQRGSLVAETMVRAGEHEGMVKGLSNQRAA